MRKLNIVAVIALTITVIATQAKPAKALSFDDSIVKKQTNQFVDINNLLGIKTVSEVKKPKKVEEKPKKEVEKPKPIEYVVVSGDTLTSIAQAHSTTVERLWAKNTNLNNQDLLNIGDVVVIPLAEEALEARPLNITVVAQNTSQTPQIAPQTVSGNTYDYGYCTWYVKNRRPDLPNRMGNANAWYGSAQAMGLATGSSPRAGAVGVSFAGFYGHVVYVESVSGNTITVSEMNYAGWNVVSSRTASASEFVYIY